MPVTLHTGAAAEIIPQVIAPRSIDMIYVDPPYFTQADWTGPAGSFSDRWRWDGAAQTRHDMLTGARPARAKLIRAITTGNKALEAYLLAMHEMIAACHRALRPHASFWLQCDDHAAAHLRLICDLVFGAHRLWGISIWKRSSGSELQNGFSRCHDTILTYARTGAALTRLLPPGKTEMDGCPGTRADRFFDDKLASTSRERAGYPTQKPTSLLRRIIALGSREGDTILDPCCGSGTTLVAARELGRSAIGIDQSADAIALAGRRTGTISHQLDLFGAA